jgi:hypothetical protein
VTLRLAVRPDGSVSRAIVETSLAHGLGFEAAASPPSNSGGMSRRRSSRARARRRDDPLPESEERP